jgi:hypothetical protein
MKVTGPIVIGCSHEYLHRLKTRVHRGWVTISDKKHVANLMQAVGFVEGQAPGKSVSTPGVDRVIEEEVMLNDDDAKSYRSGAGSCIYYAADGEEITFPSKECARSIHSPSQQSLIALKRLAQYLYDRQDLVTESLVQHDVIEQFRTTGVVKLIVRCDSDWASCKIDRGSTSGSRFTVGGYRVYHASQTQPGVASMSSGEAELRSLSKCACDALFIKDVGAEMNMRFDIVIQCDSTAALQNPAKLGPGEVKHVEIAELAIKEMVRRRMLAIEHLSGEAKPQTFTRSM